MFLALTEIKTGSFRLLIDINLLGAVYLVNFWSEIILFNKPAS